MKHHQSDPWQERVRREAYVAVEIAATRRVATDRVLAYMLRKALAHGLTVDECCRAGNLSPADVLRLSTPEVA